MCRAAPGVVPELFQRRVRVSATRHGAVHLADGGVLSGPAIATGLAGAQEVVALAVTIGPRLEQLISATVGTEPALALALEAVATATVAAVATEAIRRIGADALAAGLRAGTPLSPGMIGWPLAAGQRQLFRLLRSTGCGITLSDQAVMRPRFALSFAVGLGEDLAPARLLCDSCGSRPGCRHRPEGVP
jgi:hypothetical protein